MTDRPGRLTPLPPGPALVRRTLIAVTLGAAACGEDGKTSDTAGESTQTPMTPPTTSDDPTIAPMFTTGGSDTSTSAGETTLVPPMAPPTSTAPMPDPTNEPPMLPPMPDPTMTGTTTGETTGETTDDEPETTAIPPMPPPETTGP